MQEGLFRYALSVFIGAAESEATGNVEMDTILQQTRSMVAIAPWIAGHKGGAAVDYTVKELNGRPRSIGHEYLQVGASLVAMESPFVTLMSGQRGSYLLKVLRWAAWQFILAKTGTLQAATLSQLLAKTRLPQPPYTARFEALTQSMAALNPTTRPTTTKHLTTKEIKDETNKFRSRPEYARRSCRGYLW